MIPVPFFSQCPYLLLQSTDLVFTVTDTHVALPTFRSVLVIYRLRILQLHYSISQDLSVGSGERVRSCEKGATRTSTDHCGEDQSQWIPNYSPE
jgi:hypothetical protein